MKFWAETCNGHFHTQENFNKTEFEPNPIWVIPYRQEIEDNVEMAPFFDGDKNAVAFNMYLEEQRAQGVGIR